MKKKNLIFYAMFLLLGSKISAQSMIDISAGTSHQDNFFTNIAYRYSVSDKFRIGVESQIGSVQYRLVEAKPIKAGSATNIGIPLTVRMYQKSKIRMDFYAKPGIRLQSAPSFDNGKKDSAVNSTAISFDGGLLLTAKLSDKFNLQSGVNFPLFYEVNPSAIFENIYPGVLNFGGNYSISNKSSVFAKTAFGSALGGSGDTQKFGWTIQAGMRFSLGQKVTNNFVEPSF
jgi:hypothetical protein